MHYSVGSIVHMDERAAKLAATELLRLAVELHQQVAELEATVSRLPKIDESDRVWMAWALKMKTRTREAAEAGGEA